MLGELLSRFLVSLSAVNWKQWLTMLSAVKNYKEFQIRIKVDHVLKRLVSTVQFYHSAPYSFQNIVEIQLHPVPFPDRIFNIFQLEHSPMGLSTLFTTPRRHRARSRKSASLF
jgi:hypothetical protein